MSVGITLLARTSDSTDHEARIHAVMNRISVILGLAWIIERHVDPVARAQAVQLVDASRWLKELITRYARPDESVREEFAVADLLHLVVERLHSQAESRCVELVTDCDGSSIFADFVELAEALYNVVSDAVQASPAGSAVRVRMRRRPDGAHHWTVKDAGRCAPSHGGPSSIGLRELGLSLAFRAIGRHNGAMRVESAAESGTRVTIMLPGSVQRRT